MFTPIPSASSGIPFMFTPISSASSGIALTFTIILSMHVEQNCSHLHNYIINACRTYCFHLHNYIINACRTELLSPSQLYYQCMSNRTALTFTIISSMHVELIAFTFTIISSMHVEQNCSHLHNYIINACRTELLSPSQLYHQCMSNRIALTFTIILSMHVELIAFTFTIISSMHVEQNCSHLHNYIINACRAEVLSPSHIDSSMSRESVHTISLHCSYLSRNVHHPSPKRFFFAGFKLNSLA